MNSLEYDLYLFVMRQDVKTKHLYLGANTSRYCSRHQLSVIGSNTTVGEAVIRSGLCSTAERDKY